MNINDWSFRFHGIKQNSTFSCKRCGICCTNRFENSIMLTYSEVKRIQEYIPCFLKSKQFDKFIKDLKEFMNIPDDLEKLKKHYQEDMFDFFSILPLKKDKDFFVQHYLLRSYENSGRCVFFNPKGKKCIIYSVRPNICKLYPFMVAYNLENKVITIYIDKNHDLVGDGKINKQELKKLALEYVNERILHYTLFEKYTGIEIHKDEPEIDDFSGEDVERYNKYKEECEKITINTKRLYDPFLKKRLIEKNKFLWERIDKGQFK